MKTLKRCVKKVFLSKWMNILVVLVFCISISLNLMMDKYLDSVVMWLNIAICFWAFGYFRARSRKITFDWFYVALPLIYSVLERSKNTLQDKDLQNHVVNGAVGFLFGLGIIIITYYNDIKVHTSVQRNSSPVGSDSSVKTPKMKAIRIKPIRGEDAFFITFVMVLFTSAATFLL